MDLTTTYLGMKLRTPLVPSASPLSDEIDNIKRMEDVGASAVVLSSLFEEQLLLDRYELHHHLTHGTESFAEALTYIPEPDHIRLGAEDYLERLRKAKEAVAIPIIASLNGVSIGGWTDYANLIQEAGADALELNIYYIPTDLTLTGAEVEQTYLNILAMVKSLVTIPVAVKLSPFFSNLANMARRLDEAGADGLVLFNRFYQPDIDVEILQVRETLHLSSSSELPLRLRWIAALSGRVRADLAVTGGVHTALDGVKSVMAGAHAVQVVSALLRQGPDLLRILRADLERWMAEHEWDSLSQMRGNMNLQRCPDPAAYERANYMLMLHGWR